MSVVWKRMDSYRQGTYALFWVDDGVASYMVYGVLDRRGHDGVLRISDDNDYGYATAEDVHAWAECSPPKWLLN
ncbi:hypothetical protein [Paracoccus sp. (in: a-proteobacteria)]|uniref:hypothetical protein n=1 Tax=Paracoccus sp. TaxID=267 RepID=UPI0035B45127